MGRLQTSSSALGSGSTAASVYRASAVFMDTPVTIHLVGLPPESDAVRQVREAFGWFQYVEAVCSRFEPESEVMRLSLRVGTPVPASPVLFKLTQFAVALARLTGGAFDPAVGATTAGLGFDRSYRTGRRISAPRMTRPRATYRDILVDADRQTICLRRPLVLDLGAVAKGFAIDLAARAFDGVAGYAIDAGGDLYVRGHNAAGEPWRIGIRHPRAAGEIAQVLRLTDAAVCTSGDYERRSPRRPSVHHLVDPRTGRPARRAVSATVIAETALLADGLATAAFVLGPKRGGRLLERHGVEGVIITPSLECTVTPGVAAYLA